MNPIDDAIKRILTAIGKPGGLPTQAKRKETLQVKGNMQDSRTFSQLAEQKFSGIRANDLWLRFEIWILGRLDRTLSYTEFFNRPESLNELYAEAFGLNVVVLSDNTKRDIQHLKDRRILLNDADIKRALDARDSVRRQKT